MQYDIISQIGQYALFESHISYMFEPCYNFIANKIYEILNDLDLFKELSMHPQTIDTGYYYSVTRYNCVDAAKANKEDLQLNGRERCEVFSLAL